MGMCHLFRISLNTLARPDNFKCTLMPEEVDRCKLAMCSLGGYEAGASADAMWKFYRGLQEAARI